MLNVKMDFNGFVNDLVQNTFGSNFQMLRTTNFIQTIITKLVQIKLHAHIYSKGYSF